MSHFIQQLDDRTLCITLSEAMESADREAIHAAAKALMAQRGTINFLVILLNFRGFARGVDWGDLSFYSEFGNRIVRMAIVGESRWEADALMFTGAGARTTAIEYFSPSELAQAQRWLSEAPGATGT